MEEISTNAANVAVKCSNMVKFDFPMTSKLAGKMLSVRHESYLNDSGLADFAKKVMWTCNEVPQADLVQFVNNFREHELTTHVRGHTLDLSLASIRTIFHLPAEGEAILARVERSTPKDYQFLQPLPTKEAQEALKNLRKFQLQDFQAESDLHERLEFLQVALHVKSKSRMNAVSHTCVKQVLDDPTLRRDWGAHLHKRLVSVLADWQPKPKLEDGKRPPTLKPEEEKKQKLIFWFGSHVEVMCRHLLPSEDSMKPYMGDNREANPGDGSKHDLVHGAGEKSSAAAEKLNKAQRTKDVDEQRDKPSPQKDLATQSSQIDGCFQPTHSRILDSKSGESKLTLEVSNGELSVEPAKHLVATSEDSVDSAEARIGEGCQDLTRKVAAQLCRIVELEGSHVSTAVKFTELHDKIVSLDETIGGLCTEVAALAYKVAQKPSKQPTQVVFSDVGPLLTKTKAGNTNTDQDDLASLKEDHWQPSRKVSAVSNLSRKRTACGWKEPPGKRARRKTNRFSLEESSAIQAGIEKHGVGNWSSIRQENLELFSRSNRTDVDIKDRWRNMSKGRDKALIHNSVGNEVVGVEDLN